MNSTGDNDTTITDIQHHQCTWFLANDEILHFVHTRLSHVVFSIIIPLVSAIGLFINASFLFVVFRVQEMRTIPNFYLGSLALGDMFFVSVQRAIEYLSYRNAVPFRMEIFGFVFFTNFSCVMANMAGYIFYFNSILMILVSTVDRYLAICKPMVYREITSKKRALKLVIGCWFMAILFSGFQATYYVKETMCLQWPHGTSSPTTLKICTTGVPWAPLATMIIDLSTYILASSMFGFCSVSIVITLNKRISSGITENKQNETINLRDQIAKMVLVNTTVFMLCLAPFQFFNVDWAHYNLTGSGLFPHEFLSTTAIAGMIAMTVNSLINPLVYLAVSSRYRQAYKIAFSGQRTGGGQPK